jgi:hypothetical protein
MRVAMRLELMALTSPMPSCETSSNNSGGQSTARVFRGAVHVHVATWTGGNPNDFPACTPECHTGILSSGGDDEAVAAVRGTHLQFLQMLSGSFAAGAGSLILTGGDDLRLAGASMVFCGVLVAALGAATPRR